MKKLELNSIVVESLVAKVAGIDYIWKQDADNKRDSYWQEYIAANPSANAKVLAGVCADYDTECAFIFAISDCYSPPIYLIFGKSAEDAHETFVTEFESLVKIEDVDLADYGEEYHVNDNGTPVDTQNIFMVAVQSLTIVCKMKETR